MLVRISKAAAKKLFADGTSIIILCPNKMIPDGPWENAHRERHSRVYQRINDDIDGYGETVLLILRNVVFTVAKKWLAENLPRAWYRPMFD